MQRVVLNARAHAGLAQHLGVVTRPRLEPLGLEQLALLPQLHETVLQLQLNGLDRREQLVL